MFFRVQEGCTLTRPDGSVWAKAGELVEVDVDSKDPAERAKAQMSLKGQHAKVRPAAAPVPKKASDRSIEPTVMRGASTRKKATRKKK